MSVLATASSPDKAIQLRSLAAKHVHVLVDDLGLRDTGLMILFTNGKSPSFSFDRLKEHHDESPVLCISIISRFCAQWLPRLIDSAASNASQPIRFEKLYPGRSQIPAQEHMYHGLNERMTALAAILMFFPQYVDKYLLVSSAGARGRHLAICLINFLKRSVQKVRVELGGRLTPFPLPKGSEGDRVHAAMRILAATATIFNKIMPHLPPETGTELVTTTVAKAVSRSIIDLLGWAQLMPVISQPLIALCGMLNTQSTTWQKMDANRQGRLERCGRDGCSKNADTAQMFQCGRCQVVVYCSKRHQIEDWKDSTAPHKAWCYKTRW